MSSVTCQQEHVSTHSRLYFLLKRTSASTESARSAAVLCQLDTTAHHKLERSPFKFAEQHFQCSNVRPCYMQTFQRMEQIPTFIFITLCAWTECNALHMHLCHRRAAAHALTFIHTTHMKSNNQATQS